MTLDALEEFFGDLECHGSAFFSHLNAAFLIFHHVVIVLDEVGDVLAGGLAQPFPLFADPLMQVDGDLSAQIFGGCHSRIPPSYFCNASIYPHLAETDRAARDMLDYLMPRLAREAGATEALKAADPMKWVGLMNNCKARAEEIVMHELIYV